MVSQSTHKSWTWLMMDLCILSTHMHDKCCSEKADVVSVWSVSQSVHAQVVDLADDGLVQSVHTHVRQVLL